jgi:hypothetical protein
VAGVTVSVAERVMPAKVALTSVVLVVCTRSAVRVKVPAVAPPPTITEEGALATFLCFTATETNKPPGGAGALMVTVPIAVAPLVTLDGVTVS